MTISKNNSLKRKKNKIIISNNGIIKFTIGNDKNKKRHKTNVESRILSSLQGFGKDENLLITKVRSLYYNIIIVIIIIFFLFLLLFYNYFFKIHK